MISCIAKLQPTIWLVTKWFFVMFFLVILGEKSVILKNIDVYLAPLIEELLELWEGVDAIVVCADHNN